MSSGEKAAKGKGKPPSKTKSTKGKEVVMNDQRFRGDGLKFKCKIVGVADVDRARGDSMCAEAIKKLKAQALKSHKECGEHKQKIVMYITLKGIRILDEKTQKVQYEHPINRISFITHDPEDKKIFGYVCSQTCTTGHRMYAIKSEKPAGAITGTLYDLFQVVFKLRQEAGLSKKAQNSPQVPNNSSQVANGAKPSSSANSDGIYEEPYKNGSNKQAESSPDPPDQDDDHEYAEPIKPSARKEKDSHYKVPYSIPLPATPLSQTSEINREGMEEKEKTTSADASNPATLLSQSQSFDKEPDQVSQASIPDSPFPNHDNSSAEMAFFSASVFDTTPSESAMADTVSVASSADVSMFRSNSVSSGSSETRSAHSRSSSLIKQTATTEGVQPGFAATSDIQPSLDMKTTQEFPDRTFKRQNQGDFPVAFPALKDEKKSEENRVVQVTTVEETSVASIPDPFASSTEDNRRTQPVAGEGFFTESFAAFDTAFGDFEGKNSDNDNQTDDDMSSSDPFAPSDAAQEQGSVTEEVESFASGTSFEATFSSEPFTLSQPSADVSPDDKQTDADEKPMEEKSESAATVSWNNAFAETEHSESKPDATQSAVTSEVQFSWAESFVSDDVDVMAKTNPSTAAASFSWDDAFGGAPTWDKESSDQAQDTFAWDDDFGGKATDSSNLQFDSSPFGDAFTSSTVESTSDKCRESEVHAEPGPQSTVPDNPPLFSDSAFATPPSSSSESSADVLASVEHSESSVPSKDPFKELKISFPPPPTRPEKITPAETSNSSGSEVSTPDEDPVTTNEIVSIEVPSNENAKETFGMEDTNEIANQAKDHGLEFINENKTEKEQMNEERPSELHILKTKLSLSERPISPTTPPPLPPRPVVSAPPLPARPSSSSSTASAGISPINPHLSTDSPTSNSPRHGKKGSAKKTPPPLPPRVDLNEKLVANENGAFPDPFGADLFDNQFGNNKGVDGGDNSDWNASWPSVPELPPKQKTKDPFSDSFFTDFDFPQNPVNSKAIYDNLDPFATTNPTSEPFPTAFGNEDLFAAFTPAKVEVAFGSRDPFPKDSSDSFVAFSSDDPFGDISDPFADKGILGADPFGDSPSKPQMGEALTLNESLVASDEADSFA